MLHNSLAVKFGVPIIITADFESARVGRSSGVRQNDHGKFEPFGLMNAEDLNGIDAFFRQGAFTFLFNFENAPLQLCDDVLQSGEPYPAHDRCLLTDLLDISNRLFAAEGARGQNPNRYRLKDSVDGIGN